MSAIANHFYNDSQRVLRMIEKSNRGKKADSPLALYLIGDFDKKGEMNLNLSAHALRFKEIAKTHFLSIQVMNNGDIGAAIAKTKKEFPDRPIELFVMQTHGASDCLRFSRDPSNGFYPIRKVKMEDFDLLSSKCVICLTACNVYSGKLSIAAKIAEVSKRVVFASKTDLPLDNFFYFTDPKEKNIQWIAFDLNFNDPISVKLQYDPVQKQVVELPIQKNILREISAKLASDARSGCIDSQMVSGHLASAERRYEEALIFYRMALSKGESSAQKWIHSVLKKMNAGALK